MGSKSDWAGLIQLKRYSDEIILNCIASSCVGHQHRLIPDDDMIFTSLLAIRFNALVENIDEQKQIELKLQQTEKSVSNAIDNINTGIILWDPNDKIVMINNWNCHGK